MKQKLEEVLFEMRDELRAMRHVLERHLPDAVSTKAQREQAELLDRKRRESAERAAAKAAPSPDKK